MDAIATYGCSGSSASVNHTPTSRWAPKPKVGLVSLFTLGISAAILVIEVIFVFYTRWSSAGVTNSVIQLQNG